MPSAATSVAPEAEPEPEAPHSAQQPPQGVGVLRRSHRSCHLCNRRKVRCDKREPCGPCSRAGKQCVYPPPGEPIRRPRKTTMADVASRISNLEQSLVSARKDPAPASLADGPSATASPSPAPGPTHSAVLARAASSASGTPRITSEGITGNGVLVQRGSSSQYFNEILLSRVIEEEQDIQSVFTSPESRPPQPPVSSPFNPMGILSAPSMSHMPPSFFPPKQAALRLWSIYLDYVENCCCLKVGHVPTMEIRIYSTIDNPATAPLENLALCYSVFFATLISRGEDEVTALLGGSRTAWLTQTKMGFEQSLAHADFLDKPTMTCLHAMAIYLSALLVINRGKGNWILNGLAIRIAQSLGVQCNGEQLGLSPFESEMRRRLWWHLVNRDGRSGEDYGLQSTSDHMQSHDITLPLNVEDTDLYPEMTELPPERKGFTAMTFTLNQIDIANASYRLAGLAAHATPESLPAEEVRVQIINEMKSRVNERLKYCNTIVPRQRHAKLISTYVMRKVDLVTRQQWASLRCPSTRETCATEEDLAEAIDTLRYGLRITTDELLKPFSWASTAYPQYHVLMYVLWHLCVRPEGPRVEEAWKIVDMVFEKQLWNNLREGFGLKSAVLDALYAKARRIREKKREEIAGATAKEKDGYQTPAASDGDLGLPSSWPFGLGTMQGDTYEVMGEDGFPDWGALVRGLQMDAQHFSDTLWQ